MPENKQSKEEKKTTTIVRSTTVNVNESSDSLKDEQALLDAGGRRFNFPEHGLVVTANDAEAAQAAVADHLKTEKSGGNDD